MKTNNRQAQVYRQYCEFIAKASGLSGVELREAIRQTVRTSYALLFNNSDIRQRDMTPEQLEVLTKHREEMVKLTQV